MVPTFQKISQYTGADDLQQMMAREGFTSARRKMSEAYERRVDAVAQLFGDVLSGREEPLLLQEAMNPRRGYVVEHICRKYPNLRETMSVSDFSQYLTVDVLDRVLYGRWAVTSIPNKPLVKMEKLRDFRTVKRFEVNGAVKPFTKSMNPAEPPKQRTLTPVTPIEYSPDLYQGYESVNWRAIFNDDLGIFNDLVQRLSDSWNLTLWQAITQVYVDANGPAAALYQSGSGFKNLLTVANGASVDNPPLDFQGLIDGRTVLGKMLSPDGYPIVFTGTLYVWYGPALKTTADALLAALRADISVGGGTTNADGFPSQRLSVGPAYITGGLVPILDTFIPLVCTAGTVANTMWGLTYDPSAQPRPSGVMGILNGFETPQLLQRAPNTMRAGGGIDPMMGSFDTMDTDYKSIAVFGTTVVDGRSTVASFGQ